MADQNPVKLSVMIPVYNEKNTVLTILERVKKINIPKEIIVIDNCSTDGTRELLQKAQGIDRLILQPQNMGKGTSLRTAIPHLRGTFAIIQDGDLEYDPESFYELLAAAEQNVSDAVYGSRVLGGKNTKYATYYLGVKVLTVMINLLFGAKLTDSATTYKLVRTDVLKKLKLRCASFDLDFELTAKLCKHTRGIIERPIPYSPRTFAEGKKIRASDGFIAMWVILKARFVD